MKHLGLICTLLLVATSSFAYKQQSIDINVNGQSRNMVVYTPNVLPDNSPLFIVTHGMNQSPEYQYGSDKMYEMIDTAKFVIAYLRSDGNTWDTGGTKDQNFVIKTIDEMQARFNIDTNRVYWSGFSMGSMLIHHCIANMQDKIAAFAPTSGIQFSEQPWTNCKKPVNLLEVIAYGDDVFGYEQYGIHDYIENYAKHDKHPTYKKITGYRPVNGSWFDGDYERWTDGPNGGEVALYSYNNGGHWPMDLNRHLIWNFCKRFSLDPGIPSVKLLSPLTTDTYCQYDTVKVTIHMADADGTIRSLRIYIDGSFKTAQTSVNESEYEFEYSWVMPRVGSHVIRVLVTDNDNKSKEISRTITISDITPYRNAFNQALSDAQSAIDSTTDSIYSPAGTLYEQLQQLVEQYTDWQSSSISKYEEATQALDDGTTKLNTRREAIDAYHEALARADSLIALYEGIPEVTESQSFQRLLRARSYYDLNEAQMAVESRITNATRQLGVYCDSFENATVAISFINDERHIVSETYYTVDGRPTDHPHGIVIRQTRYVDGTVRAVKVVKR